MTDLDGRKMRVDRRALVLTAFAVGLLLAPAGVVLSRTVAPEAARSGSLPPAAPGPTGTVRTVAPAYVPASGVVDLGPVSATTRLTVEVGLASQNPSGLAAFVNTSEIQGTPAYRHFLTPAQAADQFGASSAAVTAASAYFEQFGLTTSAHPDGLILSVSGVAPDVDAAFGTSLDEYRNATGATFVSHATAATLPTIAPWTGVLGLGNVTQFTPDVRAAAPGSLPAVAEPSAACAASLDGVTPCEAATAYDYAGLDANGTNGTGETIAVFDAYSSASPETALASDFAHFTEAEGLPTGGLSFRYPVPTTANLNATGTNPAWDLEDPLDIEWARAAAPGAAVEMVFSPNGGAGLYYAIDWVVAHGAANVLSMSWGEPEVGIFNGGTPPCPPVACNATSDGTVAILGPVLELAAAEGISSFAASGDCGAAAGTRGVAVDYPASSPYVTGVGATNLVYGAGGTYLSETGWSGNSSSPDCSNHGGSGGGFSVFPRPYWQVGPGTVAGRGRGVPDVSILGGSGSPVVAYASGTFLGLEGTSVGTPIWAGLAATADQEAGAPLGLLNPGLYEILAGSRYADDLHDVTSGSNGYSAGVGWDPVTGVGTPIAASLLPDLVAGDATIGTLGVLAYASPRFGPAPLTVSFVAQAHGGTGPYATEGFEFGDGTSTPAPSGTATHTFDNPGVYSVEAYVVDATAAIAASPPVVIVVGGGSPLSVGLVASTTTPAVGAAVTFTATASGGTGPYLYNYSFGDGSFLVNASAATTNHSYPAAGGYCAEVVVRDGADPPDGGASARVAVTVGGAAAPTCGNPTTPLQLTAATGVKTRDAPADFPELFAATGGVTAPAGLSNQMSMRSNDAYTQACGCTVFPDAGAYQVTGWENDTANGEATAEVNVTVAPALTATFTASTLTGPAPLTVDFAATASGGYLASAADTTWRFGNARSAVGASVSTTYSTAGEYVALASLSDEGYGNASEAFVLDVTAPGPATAGITATVTPAVNLSSGTTVAWNATVLGPASVTNGAIVEWLLGNGQDGFGVNLSETYYASVDLLPGNTLDATILLETTHLQSLRSVPVTLPDFFATESGGFVPKANALQLATTLTDTSGVVPLAVTGTATTSGPGTVGVGWSSGDGTTAHGSTFSQLYSAEGEYTVTARAYDAYGDEAVRVSGVVASVALGLSGCEAQTLRGTAPYTVTFDPEPQGGDGPPYAYAWTLPNGSNASAEEVTITFDTPGTYHVVVEVTDAGTGAAGCAWSVDVLAPLPIGPALVLLVGAAAGGALAGFFVWVTRPRPPR